MKYRITIVLIALLMFSAKSWAQSKVYDTGKERFKTKSVPDHSERQIWPNANMGVQIGHGVTNYPNATLETLTPNPYAVQDSMQNIFYDLQHTHTIEEKNNEVFNFGNFSFMAIQERNDFSHMLTSQQLHISTAYYTHHLALTAGININRYFAIGIQTQYGVQGSVSYLFSPHFSMTVFGEYYNTVPWFYMASFPYIATNRYGGYITYRNKNYGTHIGAERYYDPFARQWIFQPIITPFIKVSRRFIVELPLGGLLREGSTYLLQQHRRVGPTIMPKM